MLKKYLINVAIIFVAIGIVGAFEFFETTDGVSFSEAVSNVSERAGIFVAVWIGFSLIGGAAAMIFHILEKARK
ncbi:MAG: hypothetical protein ACFB00_12440 [Parvularculaceae bacterium]